jgi:alcohol dehydrogenase
MSSPLPFRKAAFYTPSKILFGKDTSNEIANEISELSESKTVLVVTDKNIKALEKCHEILSILETEGYAYTVFDEVKPEPSIVTVRRLCSLARKLDAGTVIGVGGGSVLDSSKIAAISVTNLQPIDAYVGLHLIPRKGAPLICIPTTAGTGSEVTMYSVLTLEDHSKKTVVSPYIIPTTAVVDPLLTVSCPRDITAGAGMDALAHAIEAIISLDATPLTNIYALEAIKLIFKYLRPTYHQGDEVESRYYMAMAATLAGVSLCNAKVVFGHTISQAFAPFCNLPHGMASGIALPFTMEFYLPVMQKKFAEIAQVIEVDGGKSGKEMAEAMIEAVKELAQDVGVPSSLKECGVTEEQLTKIADIGLKNWPRPNSPIPLDKDNVLEALEKMWRGY